MWNLTWAVDMHGTDIHILEMELQVMFADCFHRRTSSRCDQHGRAQSINKNVVIDSMFSFVSQFERTIVRAEP